MDEILDLIESVSEIFLPTRFGFIPKVKITIRRGSYMRYNGPLWVFVKH